MIRKIIFAVLMVCCNLNLFAQTRSALIKGDFPFLKERDTVTLQMYRYNIFNRESDIIRLMCRVHYGKFSFRIPVSRFRYVSLLLPYKSGNSDGSKNLLGYLLRTGDRITYSNRTSEEFAGKGAQRWKIQRRLSAMQPRRVPGKVNTSTLVTQLIAIDSNTAKRSAYILKNKSLLGSDIASLLLADNMGSSLALKTAFVRDVSASPMEIAHCLSAYNGSGELKCFDKKDSTDTLPQSMYFCEGLIAKYRLEACLRKGQEFSVVNCYNTLSKRFRGLLREKLLTTLLYNQRNAGEDLLAIFNDARVIIKEITLKKVISDINTYGPGDRPALSMELPDSNGKMIAIHNFIGRKVLVDFWFTGCLPCRFMAKELKGLESNLDPRNVVIVSINIDKNKSKWLESIRSNQYTAKGAVNLNTNGLGNEHPFVKYYQVTGYPTLLLFDETGKRMRNPVNPANDHGLDLLSLVNGK